MIVRNIISTRSNRAVANQYIIKTDKATYFQSYHSIIAKVDETSGKITLSQYWDYSNTTRKYLYQFLNDYGYVGMNKAKVLERIKDGVFKYEELITDYTD